MDAKIVGNKPITMPTNFTIGSFTTGNFQAPQGEVMKLDLPNLSGTHIEQPSDDAPLFGEHIREAISIVKDWKKNP